MCVCLCACVITWISVLLMGLRDLFPWISVLLMGLRDLFPLQLGALNCLAINKASLLVAKLRKRLPPIPTVYEWDLGT